MILVGPVEDAVPFGAFVAFGALVDKVLANELLELPQEEHSLGICDGQRAEGVEAGVLGVPLPLGLGRDGRHQVSILAG